MTDYDFHRKIAALEKRITRLESGFKELDTTLDPEGWVGEAFKVLENSLESRIDSLENKINSVENKIDIILKHITGLTSK
jgi:exonuclease VII small subunit